MAMDAPQWIICVENPFHKACFVNKCGDDIRHCVSESTSMRPKYLDPSHSKRDVSVNFDLMFVIFVVRSRSAGSFGVRTFGAHLSGFQKWAPTKRWRKSHAPKQL